MKLSEPADSKTDPGFENCPRFEGVIVQNKLQRTYDHDSISIALCNLHETVIEDNGQTGFHLRKVHLKVL